MNAGQILLPRALARSLARSRNRVCVRCTHRAALRVCINVHARPRARCVRARLRTQHARGSRVHCARVRDARASRLHPYGNTAIYPAEVYTRVAAVNSRPGYRQRNRTRSHCMNIICIQVGYMAAAGISWLARINDYMDPTDVGGPATPRSPRLALYALLRPPIPLPPTPISLPPSSLSSPSSALRTRLRYRKMPC